MFSRMIRPMTISDIDTMHISLAEKRKLAAQLDTSKKQTIMLERANWVIPRDSMFKYGVAAIGEFIAKDSITPNDESGVGYDWYAVKPNRKLMYDKYVLRIPNGYVIANDLFFVEPSEVRLEEPSAIKKFRPTTNKNIDPPNIKKMDSTSIKNAVVAKPSPPLKTKKHHRKKA
ncbi:MAG: hypothetical protein C0154_09815 [Mucilaginibacter sp.]|nr:MAG: hypothetical protein BGO48_01920 [Mucilaginibacter sp. 44-25]PLW89778.1 MAG: hypothetical protein C0154_09815 [Mucilaginibacter sp.]